MKITITKADYDDLIYPFVAVHQPDGVPQWRVNCSVLELLEKAGVQLPPTPESQLPKGQRYPPPPMYVMVDPEAEFELGEGEVQYMIKRVEVIIREVQSRRTRTLRPLMVQLQSG